MKVIFFKHGKERCNLKQIASFKKWCAFWREYVLIFFESNSVLTLFLQKVPNPLWHQQKAENSRSLGGVSTYIYIYILSSCTGLITTYSSQIPLVASSQRLWCFETGTYPLKWSYENWTNRNFSIGHEVANHRFPIFLNKTQVRPFSNSFA